MIAALSLCGLFAAKIKTVLSGARQERSFMFQEEMDKIREAENEADRRLAECEATVRKMKEEAEEQNRASFDGVKTQAARLRDEKRAAAEKQADALKKEAAEKAAEEAEKIRLDAETRLSDAVSLITEGVKKHGSR